MELSVYPDSGGRSGGAVHKSVSGALQPRLSAGLYPAVGHRDPGGGRGTAVRLGQGLECPYAADAGHPHRTERCGRRRICATGHSLHRQCIDLPVQEGANVAVEEYGYDWKGNRIRKSREGEIKS